MERQNDIEKCLDEIDRLKTAYAKQKAENNLLKQTINGYIADQGIWINGCQCAQKENEQLKAEIERLTVERDKAKRDNTSLLYNVSRVEKQNAELQKQVDGLKEENNRYAELFGMVGKDFYTVEVDEWEKVKTGVKDMIQQAVKYTAKEIFTAIVEEFVFSFMTKNEDYKNGYDQALTDYDNNLKKFFKERYGVEVE